MSCNHVNPDGYLFCAHCGQSLEPVRCRCGFVTARGDVFCGRCGVSLSEEVAARANKSAMDVDHRFNLENIVQQAAQEKKFIESVHKAHVTQDDIRKLLAARRKKF
ncbi:MAG: zinc ribbon domain-containing protein [Gallionellaceae bacterium]